MNALLKSENIIPREIVSPSKILKNILPPPSPEKGNAAPAPTFNTDFQSALSRSQNYLEKKWTEARPQIDKLIRDHKDDIEKAKKILMRSQ